ncbi:MAG: phospholipid/cholesterol/gamma-HCH transport system substrate-binding protein [Mycobacterium sp.]|nr:virulence factor Mce family protein [Mycobacterium sp.]MDT5133979.1 phospholipid/cholesterol/gamma-HCH transport system substrate-binding protein [Mycobacterium sp.]
MERRPGEQRIHQALWTLILFIALGLFLYVTISLFAGVFTSYVPVSLASDRSGLVMEDGAKVKMRGVQVGRVGTIQGGSNGVRLKLQIYPDQLKYIPANVGARIRATTAFGAKYVDLIYPSDPSPKRLSAGQVIQSQNVSTEVNTVFQNLTDLLNKVDPAKLNAVLTALADGLRGEGPTIGAATTDANQVLLQLNPRAETLRRDWHSVQGFSDTYSAAAANIITVLDSLNTTSPTITANAAALDSLLANVIGFSQSGIGLLGPNKDNLVTTVNTLESTTSLLLKYNPELTCMLVGGKYFLDHGGYDFGGGANGKSAILDTGILLGDDPYKYPDNLPVVGAKGGPGGKPGCSSLPDVSKNWPVRQMVTNTGFGTGLDWRPNPGIGFPGYANYLPVTRAVPEPPSIRYPGGPAPGPIPYPGAPPYGAPMYAPDGTPLYPGEPPAPPPGAPREPGPPPPGSEPFVVPAPGSMQPTPTPPLPEQAVPAP